MLKKIAIPTAGGSLCLHFGHCEQFMVFDVDVENKEILGESFLTPPPHEPGVLPRFMKEKNINVILAGGMGSRAQDFFKEFGIEVIVGAQAADLKQIVNDYLTGNLKVGINGCSH